MRHHQEDAPQEIQWAINREQDVETTLAQVESHAHAAGLEVTSVASQGNPADVLVKYASEQGADVLVVGNKGSGNFVPKGKLMMIGFATYAVACLDCGYLGGSLSEEDRSELEKKVQDA